MLNHITFYCIIICTVGAAYFVAGSYPEGTQGGAEVDEGDSQLARGVSSAAAPTDRPLGKMGGKKGMESSCHVEL